MQTYQWVEEVGKQLGYGVYVDAVKRKGNKIGYKGMAGKSGNDVQLNGNNGLDKLFNVLRFYRPRSARSLIES